MFSIHRRKGRLVSLFESSDTANPWKLASLSESGSIREIPFPMDAAFWDINDGGDLLVTPGRFDVSGSLRWLEPGHSQERSVDLGEFTLDPALSDDGSQLCCTVLEDSSWVSRRIHITHASETQSTRLEPGELKNLSSDGKQVLALVRSSQGHYQFSILPTGQGATRVFPGGEWLYDAKGSILDSDHVLAFGRTALDPVAKPFILESHASQPRRLEWEAVDLMIPVSPDGRMVMALQASSGGEKTWRRLEIANGTATPLPVGCKGMTPVGWTQDGQGVWLTRSSGGGRLFPLEVWRADLRSGKVERMRVLNGPGVDTHRLLGFAITPDGRSYAYAFNHMDSVRGLLYRISGLL